MSYLCCLQITKKSTRMPREEEMEQDFDEKLVLDEIQKQQLQEHGADEEEEEEDDEGSSTTSPTADGAAPKKTKKLSKQQSKIPLFNGLNFCP